MNGNPKFNGSGCKDLTAHAAIKHISDQEKKADDLIRVLKYVIRNSGFKLVGRITLTDAKGREFK